MTPEGARRYSSPGLWWSSLVSAVVFGGYCATYGVLVLFDVVELGGPRATGDRIAIALIFLALAAASVALWWFLGRVALRVDDREVVVENRCGPT